MTTLHPEHAHEQQGEVELRHHFDDELDEIRRGLVDMGSRVVENTKRAGEAAVENRLDLVEVVRAGDGPINELYRILEQRTEALPVFLALLRRVQQDEATVLAMEVEHCLLRNICWLEKL